MSTHDDHGNDHGHDHDHGHAEPTWGDYNAEEPEPSTLPPIGPLPLGIFALALAALLSSIVLYSLGLATRHETHDTHDEAEPAHHDHEEAH